MAIPAVGGNSAAQTITSSAPPAVSLNGDTFMKLFTQQIANQDPMSPMNSSDFLNQFAQVSSVQTMQGLQTTLGAMNTALDSMRVSSQQTTAQGLVGKQVTYQSPSGLKTGTVGSVQLVPGADPALVLQDGSSISLNALRQVS